MKCNNFVAAEVPLFYYNTRCTVLKRAPLGCHPCTAPLLSCCCSLISDNSNNCHTFSNHCTSVTTVPQWPLQFYNFCTSLTITILQLVDCCKFDNCHQFHCCVHSYHLNVIPSVDSPTPTSLTICLELHNCANFNNQLKLSPFVFLADTCH